jgi:hypothetical protein
MSTDFHRAALDEVPWTLPPGSRVGVRIKFLGESFERGPWVMLVEQDAGYTEPPHWHEGDTVYVVRRGTLTVAGEGVYRPGDVRRISRGVYYGPETAGSAGVEFWLISNARPLLHYEPPRATPDRGAVPRLPPIDRVLIACFALFAFTSIFMEPYVTFGVDLTRAGGPLARAWYFYARSWDPLFLDPPLYLRVMTGVDEWIFGPMYVVLIYAFLRRREWIRAPALLYCGAIVYSTLVYFLTEFLGEGQRANLAMVTAVNIPYAIIPCALAWRFWGSGPIWETASG